MLSTKEFPRASRHPLRQSILGHSKDDGRTLSQGPAPEIRKEGGTNVVRPDRVDFLDLMAECHGLVCDKLDEIMRCTLASKKFELIVNRACPCRNDAKADLLQEYKNN